MQPVPPLLSPYICGVLAISHLFLAGHTDLYTFDPYVERKSSNAIKNPLRSSPRWGSSAHLNVFDLQRGLSDGERADLLQQASFNIIDENAPVYLGNAQKHTD